MIRASTSSSGAEGTQASYDPKFVPGSDRLLFTSYADNLSGDDANGTLRDVFLKDLESGETSLMSANDANVGGDDESDNPVVSPDGTRIAFGSRSSNLGFAVPAGISQVYMRDLTNGSVTLVSVTQSGVPSDADVSPTGEISFDNSRVAFYGRSTNLGSAEGTRGNYDVFVKDLTTQVVKIASRTKTDVLGEEGEFAPTLAPDGLSVAYYGNSPNLVPNPPQNGENIYLKDLKSGPISRLSVTPDGQSPTGRSYFPLFAPTGQRLAYFSDSNDIAPFEDANTTWDVFDVDVTTGENTLVSKSEAGNGGNAESMAPGYSRDGTRIAFFSAASNLIDGSFDPDTKFDLFIKSLRTGKVQRIRLGEQGTTEGGGLRTMGDAEVGPDWSPPTFSTDGSVIAFGTDASLVPADTNGRRDIYAARVTVNDPPVFQTTSVTDSIDEDTTYRTSLDVTDPDGDAITYSVSQQPSRGTVEVAEDGTVTYTPTANFFGNDQFQIQAKDSFGATAATPVTYAITVKSIDDPATDVTFRQSVTALDETNAKAPSRTTVVGKITITDVDGFSGDLLTSDDRFDILQTGPNTATVRLLPGQILDREKETEVDLELTARDSSTFSEIFPITIRDVNEYKVSVPKDVDPTANQVRGSAASGTKVGVTVAAIDRDATNNAVTFELLDGAGEFALDGSRSIVVAGALNPAGGLQRALRVRASSSDGSTAVGTFTVTIDPTGETIEGKNVGETLVGTAWNDTIDGNGGGDVLRGGSGDDVMDGGAGNDTGDFSDRTGRVVVTLRSVGTTTATVGASERDTLTDIENVIGGSGDDKLIGDGASNIIAGGPGSDLIDGGVTGPGDPTDVADFSTTPGPVVLSLDANGRGTASTGSGADTLKAIEDIRGSARGDTLASARTYARFEGGPGGDRITGNGKFHRVVYEHAKNAVKVDLKAGVACNVTSCKGTEGRDILTNIIWATGSRSPDGDVLIGDDQKNVFDGLEGPDTMTGGKASDEFFYWAVADSPFANPDVITDFSTAKGSADLVNLCKLGKLTSVTGAFTGTRQMRLVKAGSTTRLEVNMVGKGPAEMAIVFRNAANVTASFVATGSCVNPSTGEAIQPQAMYRPGNR